METIAWSDYLPPVPTLAAESRTLPSSPAHAVLHGSFGGGGLPVEATFCDFLAVALDPVALSEDLPHAFFTDVALYCSVCASTGSVYAYLSDFHYSVSGRTFEFHHDQLVEIDGRLGKLAPGRTISLLLILPMAARGEAFTLHFGGDSRAIRLPRLGSPGGRRGERYRRTNAQAGSGTGERRKEGDMVNA